MTESVGQPDKGPSWRSSRQKPLNLKKIKPTNTELFSVLRGFCVIIEDIAEYSHIEGEDHQDLLYVASNTRKVLNILEAQVGKQCSKQGGKKQR
jgi:hypothetical protein